MLRIDDDSKRAFFEIESLKNNWSGRELERQINSLLYERLALSKNKEGVMRLATKGQEIQKPADVFKDPTEDVHEPKLKSRSGHMTPRTSHSYPATIPTAPAPSLRSSRLSKEAP